VLDGGATTTEVAPYNQGHVHVRSCKRKASQPAPAAEVGVALLVETSLRGGLNASGYAADSMRPGTTIVIIILLAVILIAAAIQIAQIMSS